MGFFDQHKALIITVLLLSILLLLMYNIHLSNSRDEMRETLVDLEQFQPEESEEPEEEQPEAEEETPSPQQNNAQTHQAYNQNREENQQSFQSRLDEILERNSADQTASEEESTNPSEGDFNVSNNKQEESRKQSDGENTSEKLSTEQGNYQNSSIAFSLVGRSAFHIPNPIYTCDRPGKIVVNITVNEEGRVTGTSINKGSSTSRNECLINNALEYASAAVFSRLSGRNEQKGTITYNFQG